MILFAADEFRLDLRCFATSCMIMFCKLKFVGCWLVDGPVFLGQLGKRCILIRSLFGKVTNTFMDDAQSWDTQLLNFDQIDKNNSMRAIYYGELELFSEPALLLSIHLSDDKDFDFMPSNNRSTAGIKCTAYHIMIFFRRKCWY